MHLEILIFFYNVEQPKFTPLPFHISLLLWQLIRKDSTSDYDIKAYIDLKHNKRSEIILTYCCFGHVHVSIPIYVYILDKFWPNDLDLSIRNGMLM